MGSYRSSFQLYSEFVPVEESGGGGGGGGRAQQPEHQPLRFYSVRECARLQGIPDDFVLEAPGMHPHAAYRLVGNAVCPAVVAAACQALMEWLALSGAPSRSLADRPPSVTSTTPSTQS
jgi:site-specific DNA-cytosine methylase